MELTARSATWAKQAGKGLYTLTLSGVSKSVKVRSTSKSGKVSLSPFSLTGVSPYWDSYGEVTGQFTDGGKSADAPLAVIAVRGVNGVALVQLLELKSSGGGKLVYTGRLLADTNKARYQVREISGWYFLKNDLDDITAVKVPRNKNDVHVVIDMPRRIDQPRHPEAQAQAATAAKKASPPARASMPTMTCYGNKSSYLAECAKGSIWTPYGEKWGWQFDPSGNLPSSACTGLQPSGGRSAFRSYWEVGVPQSPLRTYFYYQDVGIVGMQFRPPDRVPTWSCGAAAPGYTRSDLADRRRATSEGMRSVIFGHEAPAPFWFWGEPPLKHGFKFGQYYGVYSSNSVTYYATDRCSAFLAEWSARGACW